MEAKSLPENSKIFIKWLESLNITEKTDVLGSAMKHFGLDEKNALALLNQYGSINDDPCYEPGIT